MAPAAALAAEPQHQGQFNSASAGARAILFGQANSTGVNPTFLVMKTTANVFSIQLTTDVAGYTFTGTTAVATNTWYHLALVRSGGTLTLYRNGSADTSGAVAGTVPVRTTNFGVGVNGEYTGSYGTSFGTRMMGWLDEFRFTKGVARYTAAFTPPTVEFPGAPLPSPPSSPAPVANYEYDANGNPIKTIQAPGVSGFNFATANTYDALNRVKDSTNAKAGVTQFGYNGREDLTQVTDPRSLVTQYPRNGLGDATSLVSPDTGTATKTYDAAGNLKTSTDSRGVLATYTYDALNRLTGIVYSKSGPTSLTYSWAYDQTGTGYANGIGRLTSTTHPSGSTQYTYDAQGRLLTDIQRVNAATGANSAQVSKTVTYTYDAAGNVASILYPSGRKLSVTYTGGLLSAMSLAKDTTSTPVNLISAVQWEPFGGVKSWQWQLTSGTQSYDRLYDNSGRLVRYRLGNAIRDITYDAGDRITAYTHYDAGTAAATPSLDQGFSYDELGRLTGATTASASWSIGYDANGNRTSLTLNGTTSTYTTPSTSNRLTSITNPARSLGYDNAGNTTSDSYTATYNLAGRLATLVKAGTTTTYAVDGLGRRVRKFSSTGSSSTILFVYDQQGQLLGEYNSAGTALREYVWLNNTPVAVFTPDPANSANPPIAYYIHTDHLGAPRVIVDTANNQRWNWLAEPFGTNAPNTNPLGLGAFTFNLRFPGQYADVESGLSYNFFRDYDASMGRYVQSDPIGLEGGINTFVYVENQPTMQIDPEGLMGFGGGGSAGRGQPGPGRVPNDFTPCDYYQQMCQKTGCRYYCFTGPLVCRNAQVAPSWFSYFGASKLNCVRRCLVRQDQKIRKDNCNDKDCLSDQEIDKYHETCFTECGVPPGAYPGVNPPWLPFNGNKQ